jgi:hypothetical protein
MLFRPKPATSNGVASGDGIAKGMRTQPGSYQYRCGRPAQREELSS